MALRHPSAPHALALQPGSRSRRRPSNPDGSPNLLPWGGESTKAQQAARGGVTRLKGPAAASAIIAGRPESSVPLMDPKLDPCVSSPDAYQVLFENDRVRVLRYHDHPRHRTVVHAHPDSVMVTLSSFRRRLGGRGARGRSGADGRRGPVARRPAALGREHRRHRNRSHLHRAQRHRSNHSSRE